LCAAFAIVAGNGGAIARSFAARNTIFRNLAAQAFIGHPSVAGTYACLPAATADAQTKAGRITHPHRPKLQIT
jgi:hypothetical protein